MELTGVYASLNGARGGDRSPGTFEILLSSAGDVRTIARPPWWTLRRLLALTGGLGAVLVLAGVVDHPVAAARGGTHRATPR